MQPILKKHWIGNRLSGLSESIGRTKNAPEQEEDYFIKWEQDEDAGEFYCNQCGETIYSRQKFNEHVRGHEDLKKAIETDPSFKNTVRKSRCFSKLKRDKDFKKLIH